MADEIEAETPAAATEGAPATTAAPDPPKRNGAAPPGKDFAEMTPEQQARFDRIYGQMKEYERIAGRSAQALAELHRKLEAAEARQAQESLGKHEADLKAKIADANARGAYDEAADLTGKLAQHEAAKIIPKVAPQPAAAEPAADALTREEYARVSEWAAEVSDGDFVRPWARPGHPRQEQALTLANDLMAKPGWRVRGLDALLAEVDRRMAPARSQQPSGAALSSDGRPAAKKGALPPLTPQEQRVAAKMGLKPEDYQRAKAAGL